MKKLFHPRPLLTAIAVVWGSLLLAGCGAGSSGPLASIGGASALPASGPAGSDVQVTEPGEYGKPDDEAEAARKYVWKYIPTRYIVGAGAVVIVSRQPGEIVAVEARDHYAAGGAGAVDPYTLTGFTSFSGNDTANPSAPTTIYLSRSIWGDAGQISHWSVHEFGHVVYWTQLTADQRSTWSSTWQDAQRRGALPSAYAGNSEYEGFAECFAFDLEGGLSDGALRAWFTALPR